MPRAHFLAAPILFAAASVYGVPAAAQTEIGVDLGLFSSYVWRGLSLTNKPVAQPAVWAAIPVGNASVTLGVWSSIDLGQYDDLNDDFSQSGGTSSFNLAEYEPYAEVSFTVGNATLTGGGLGYVFPNDAGFTEELNTLELYGKASLDIPLSPGISLYYDVDNVDGAYVEGSLGYSIGATEKVSIDLGATAGFSAGQGSDPDAAGLPQSEFFNFFDDGFTHLDLSAEVPLTAGPLSLTPVVHLVIAGDDFTKLTSPTDESDTKLWGGVSISWSRALGAAPEEEGQP
jgi:Bacterial protein of unknown function (Gcw_chp)